MDEFMWQIGSALMEMRLIIEGALLLYEETITPGYTQAMADGKAAEAAIIDTLEGALRSLKDRVSDLQTDYKKTMIKQQ